MNLSQLKTLYHIGNLTQLRNLNISKCANVKNVTELHKCSSLQSLNLSGLKLSPDEFNVLEGKQNAQNGINQILCFIYYFEHECQVYIYN